MPGSLAARNISKSYAAVQVLDGVSLVVAPGDRIGIVGPNGIGKSTLLRVLAGLERGGPRPVVRAGAVGYLPQEPEARAGETVRDYLARRTGVGGAERRWTGSRRGSATSPSSRRLLRCARPLPRARRRGLRRARRAPCSTTSGSGRARSARCATLSGGEAARAALAAILLAALRRVPARRADEQPRLRRARAARAVPRRRSPAGVVLVSHDRAFLDRAVTRVVEIEAETRRVHEYAGTWSEYEAARERARAAARGARTRTTSASATATRRCSRPAPQAHRSGASASWRGRPADPTGARRTPCAARSRRRSTTSSGSRRSRSRGRRGGCGSSSPRRRRPARSRELAGAVVERGSFTLGPLSTSSSASATASRSSGANGPGKTTLIRALTGELPLAARRAARRARQRSSASSTRRATSSRRRCSTTSPSSRGSPRPRRARCSRSSRSAPTTSTAPAAVALAGRAHARRRSRCSPRGASTASSSTSRRTTSTSRRSRSSRRRSTTTTGCLVVVTHDRRFLERLAVTRTIEL